MGGGIIEADCKYSGYKEINGIMIPHSLNLNNMITLKISEAEVKPLDPVIFTDRKKLN